jgi:hypothetical protein
MTYSPIMLRKYYMNRLLLAVVALVCSSASWGGLDVGWIEKIIGSPGDVQILRNSKKVDAAQFLPIQRGDQIIVNNVSTIVEVTFANGQRTTVSKSRPMSTDWTAKEEGKVPSLASNLLNWMTSMGKKDPQQKRIVIAATRRSEIELSKSANGKRLFLPLIVDDTTLIEGKRAVALAWQGGTAPYEVRIVRMDTQLPAAVFRQVGVNRVVGTVELTQGVYELVVTDSVGISWQEKVVEVVKGKLPDPPVELKALPVNVQRTMQSIWLAGIEQGKWALEAYTILVTKPQQDAADKLVLDAFELGDLPNIQ